jgi:nucleotide-binding universal stress UspA family protein
MKKLLFPTDFSEAADTAFTYALPLARALGANIHCLHAYNLANTADWLAPSEMIVALQADEEQRALKQMATYHEQMKADAKQPVSLHPVLRVGFATDVVSQVCAEIDPFMVVMGTKGATSPIDRMLGSITSQVISNIKQPILAVPEQATYVPIRRIAYATNFTEKDRGAISVLGDLAKAMNASVVAVSVIDPSDAIPSLAETRSREAQYRQDTGVDDLLLHYVQAAEVSEALAQFMETEGAEVLAVTTEHRGFFESLFHQSLTRRLALYAHKPLLVCHS